MLTLYGMLTSLYSLLQAKLQYAPVELDPEEMCRMASENPQVLFVIMVTCYHGNCTGTSKLFSIRRRGNLLLVHEVCTSIHLCSLYYHTHGTR